MPSKPQADGSTPVGELEGNAWLPSGWQDVNVAVSLSGGADSMALLRACRQFKEQLGGAGQLLAMHVNHQLRGEESADDARWCQQQCDLLNLPLEVMTCDTAQQAQETGEGIENAARAERYRLLTETAQQAGVRYLATAHTYDDHVETVLFRILRGTGLRGMAGIPQTRALSPSITLIRPLLTCSREMILRYLSDLGQEYRQDCSNSDRRFTRNRLRLDLLPLLREEYNEDIDSALVRLATQAASAQQSLEHLAEQLLEESQPSSENRKLRFKLGKLTHHQHAIVCEALRIAWRKAGLPEQAMTYEWWNRLAELAQEDQGSVVLNLPGNVRASTNAEQLTLEW